MKVVNPVILSDERSEESKDPYRYDETRLNYRGPSTRPRNSGADSLRMTGREISGGDVQPNKRDRRAHRYTPILSTTNAATSARSAANTVLTKFTESFPIFPAFSHVAPKTLSRNMPATPATATIGVHCHGTIPKKALTHATMEAATHPLSVPSTLMAPLVPIAAARKSVIMYALFAVACPTSLETVSAAASASAAIAAISKTSLNCGIHIAGKAQRAAAHRLARTWEAVRPRLRSATPRVCLRA